MISPEDVERIARRVVELQREHPKQMTDSDPWMTREEVEQYLGVSRKLFWRMRRDNPALKPCSETPLRWSKRNVDGWKLAQSLPASARRKVA